MRFARHIFSTGMHLLVNNSILLQENTSKTFTYSIAEEVTDVSHIGDSKEEFLSSILKLFRLTGHCQLNGEDLNIKAYKNGG